MISNSNKPTNKMKKYIIISLLFLFAFNVRAQLSGNSYDLTMSPYRDFYSLNYQSVENAGKGYTGIASTGDIMSSALNPAAFNIEKKYQAYLEYDFKSSMNWLPSLSTNLKLRESHPLFAAGLGYKINKNFQTGIILRCERNYMFDLGEIIVTNEFGTFLGRYNAFETFTTQTLSVPASYAYKDFKFGVNLNLVLLHGRRNYGFDENNRSRDAKNDKIRFIPDFGIKYNPFKDLSFGLAFTPGIEQQLEWQFSDASQIETTITYFPWKIGAGFEARLLESKLMLSGEYRYERTSVYENAYQSDLLFYDRHNVYIGAEYSVDDKFTVRGGIFTLFDIRRSHNEFILDNDLAQINGTIGAGYKFGNVRCNFAFINAFSKQADFMRINIGASYDF
jgi:long-subunit fatty acid transport protein